MSANPAQHSQVHAYILDIGNVLIQANRQEILGGLALLTNVPASFLSTALIDSGLTWNFECGRLSASEFAANLRLAISSYRDGNDQFSDDEFFHALCTPLKPMTDSLITFKRLLEQTTPVALASNTNLIHWQRMLEIMQESTTQQPCPAALSFAIGAYKPDEAIFTAAWNLVGRLEKSSCLFIDDSLTYVEAARNWGFQAAHFDGKNSLGELIFAYSGQDFRS
jgi:FMN phosphatase YigB (HAD superfamily)